jgi:ribose transport system permease protein
VLERYALLVLFVLLCVSFSLYGPTSDTFTSGANLRNILGNEAVIAVTALAPIIPLTCGQFDLSVGAVVGLSSMVTASASAEHGLPVPVAILLGVLAGCVVGLISLYTSNQVISIGIPESITALRSGTWLGLPRTLFSLVVGTLLGVLFVAVSVNGLVLAGAADWVEPRFNGTALIVAGALSTAIARRRSGR